jgi:hypothetical protein
MITSDSIQEIAKALFVFQEKVGKIKKDANNPFFKSKYAELDDIQQAIHEPLQAAGLVVVQFPEDHNTLTTRLVHVSGEWLQGTYTYSPVPEYYKEKDKDGKVTFRGDSYVSPQAQGSAITYAKRYAIAAILNLQIGDDDDGNQASARSIPAKRPPVIDKPLMSKAMFEKAIARIDKGEKELIQKVKSTYILSKDQALVLDSKK